MTWNGKRPGETGKGDKPRSSVANLDKVDFSATKICGSCDSFKGANVVGKTICAKDYNYYLNKDTHQCEGWNRNR